MHRGVTASKIVLKLRIGKKGTVKKVSHKKFKSRYGSFNNYLYCEEHGMKKYMKFIMFKKETTDKAYRDNPYRAVNFSIDENGKLTCPNGKKFNY